MIMFISKDQTRKLQQILYRILRFKSAAKYRSIKTFGTLNIELTVQDQIMVLKKGKKNKSSLSKNVQVMTAEAFYPWLTSVGLATSSFAQIVMRSSNPGLMKTMSVMKTPRLLLH
jgi:hypothetical protein